MICLGIWQAGKWQDAWVDTITWFFCGAMSYTIRRSGNVEMHKFVYMHEGSQQLIYTICVGVFILTEPRFSGVNNSSTHLFSLTNHNERKMDHQSHRNGSSSILCMEWYEIHFRQSVLLILIKVMWQPSKKEYMQLLLWLGNNCLMFSNESINRFQNTVKSVI